MFVKNFVHSHLKISSSNFISDSLELSKDISVQQYEPQAKAALFEPYVTIPITVARGFVREVTIFHNLVREND